jgi:5-formyltetrahydrofolate cyclo-ligase
MDKNEIRKIFKKKRRELSADFVLCTSELVCQNLIINFGKILAGKKLAFYIAANNEVDPSFALKYFRDQGCKIALPRIGENNEMLFKEYNLTHDLEKNNLYTNILEPKLENKNIVPDAVFVPLVAFDKNCNRVGMGRGFYDKTIRNLRGNLREKNSQTKFFGMAYNMQLCDTILKDEWDQSLDFIVSETEVFFCDQ